MAASFTLSLPRSVSCLLGMLLTSLCTPSPLKAAAPETAAPARPLGPQEQRALALLRPRMVFSGASLAEAISYLHFWWQDVELVPDANGRFPDGRFNIVLVDDAPDVRIALNEDRDITLHEGLRLCAGKAGMAVTYVDDAALVHKPGHPPQLPVVVSPLMTKARTLVVPKIVLYHATVVEAAAYLRTWSRDLDPAHQALNILVNPGTEKSHLIDLELTGLPLSEALLYVALQAHVRLEATADALVFSPK